MVERIFIRPFERADQAATRWLIIEGLGEHFGFIDETRNPDLDDIYEDYPEAGNTFIVAARENEIVGTGVLRAESQVAGRLARMSVASVCRRRGIGRTLVDRLIATAKRRGFSRLVLETDVPWIEVIEFYKRYRFVEYVRDGVGVQMELPLR